MIIELYQHIINIYKIYLNFLAREIFFLFCKVDKMVSAYQKLLVKTLTKRTFRKSHQKRNRYV